MRSFEASLYRFIRDEDGTVTIEAILIIPIMVWAVVAMLNFWDVFRTYNVFQKASHTVSNTISRTKKTTSLTATDLLGYYRLINLLMPRDEKVSVRITSYRYKLDTDEYIVRWSCGMGGYSQLSDAGLASFKSNLPIMADGDVHMLLETKFQYEPLFELAGGGAVSNIGALLASAKVDAREMREFISERPRDGSFTLAAGGCPTVS